MKKKNPPWRHTTVLPLVVLYEGDIDDLVSILRTSENSTVSFNHGDTVYETLAELREHQGEVLRELSLEVETRVVDNDVAEFTTHSTQQSSVSLESNKPVILSCDSAHELQFRQATDFLKARRRWILDNDYLWAFVAVCLIVLPVLGFFSALSYLDPSPQRAIIMLGIGVVWAATFWFSPVSIRRNLILLKKRHEHAGFFRRNESQIVRAGFGFAGGILGYVIRLLQE